MSEKPKQDDRDENRDEKDTTPGFDFKFDIEHEGKIRKAEMSTGGLYVFDKDEKFESRPAVPPEKTMTHVWVGIKPPYPNGRVIAPKTKASDFKSVKIKFSEMLTLTKTLTKKR